MASYGHKAKRERAFSDLATCLMRLNAAYYMADKSMIDLLERRIASIKQWLATDQEMTARNG